MRPDTDSLDLAVTPCDDCAPTTRWERRDLTATSEAWLGTCEICGSMQVLALGIPDTEIKDPLAFYLTGDPGFRAAGPRPAWQRFYALTTGAPYFLKWDFETAPCHLCQANATVGTRIVSPRWRRALSLCLNCGHATVDTIINMPNATATRLDGMQWTPADPAVKTLRKTVIETYRRWVEHQERRRRSTGDDSEA